MAEFKKAANSLLNPTNLKNRRVQVIRSFVSDKLNHYSICPTCDKIVLANKENEIKKHFLDHFRKQIIDRIILAKDCKKCGKTFGQRDDIVSHYAIEHAMINECIDDTFEINTTMDSNFPDNIHDITEECKAKIIHYLNGGSPNSFNGKIYVDKRKVSIVPITEKAAVVNEVIKRNPFVIEKPINVVKSPPKTTTNKPKNIVINNTNSISFKNYLVERLGKNCSKIEQTRQSEIKRPKRERPTVDYNESLDVLSQKVSRTGTRERPVVNYDESSHDTRQKATRIASKSNCSLVKKAAGYQRFNLNSIPSHFKFCQVSIEKLPQKIVDKYEIISYEPELIDLIDSDFESDSDILEISDIHTSIESRILTPVKSLCSDDDYLKEDVSNSIFSKPLAQSSPLHSRSPSPFDTDKTSSKVASTSDHNIQNANKEELLEDENKEINSIEAKDDNIENELSENKQAGTENDLNDEPAEKVNEKNSCIEETDCNPLNKTENKSTEMYPHENFTDSISYSTEINEETSIEKLYDKSKIIDDFDLEKDSHSVEPKEMSEQTLKEENNENKNKEYLKKETEMNGKAKNLMIIKFVDETKIDENHEADNHENNDDVEDKLNKSCELLEDFSDLSFNTSVSDVMVQDNFHSDSE